MGEARAGLEWGAGMLWPLEPIPGDGHPVLVLPGFLAPDWTTALLRRRLIQWGHDARPWELGVNCTPPPQVLPKLVARIRALHRETGRAVSLVGWSLGGALAHAAATLLTKEVRCVITLGSPLQASSKMSRLSGLFEAVLECPPDDPSVHRWMSRRPRHPFTAVVSRHDGVVAEWGSHAPKAPRCETVFVPATHLGMVLNPCVLHVIADRLAQPEGRWRRFTVARAPGVLRAAWMLA